MQVLFDTSVYIGAFRGDKEAGLVFERWRGKAPLWVSPGPIERKRCASNRSRSQRAEIQSRRAIQKAIRIAQRHFHIGQQPMRDQNRLGTLQMRIAGHDGVAGSRACSTSALAHAARPSTTSSI